MSDWQDTRLWDSDLRPRVSIGRRIAVSATGAVAVFAVVSFLVALIPVFPFTLLEHFRVQYVAVGLVVVAATAALRLRGWFDVALITTLATVCLVVPGLRTGPRTMPGNGAAVRLLLANVHTSNTHYDQVAKLIADTKADIVVLLEMNEKWREAMEPALSVYPRRIEATRPDNFGIALYARGRLEGAVEYIGGSGVPSIVAGVSIGEATFTVVATHPVPPVSSANFKAQDAQLAALAGVVRGLAAPVVVAGDLNATPWSRLFARLVTASGLCDSRQGFGVQASFPAGNFVARIPIDHVLMSCSVGVADRRVERDVGSDHLPVVVDLVFPSCPHGRWCE